MRICGVDLKGSDAIFALIDVDGEDISPINSQTRKIRFGESSEQESARHFFDAISGFIRDHQIDHVAIRQRAKKGPFAGGPVTFKMEGLFQLCPDAHTRLFSGPSIAAANRSHSFDVPNELNQYQLHAYLTACCAAVSIST